MIHFVFLLALSLFLVFLSPSREKTILVEGHPYKLSRSRAWKTDKEALGRLVWLRSSSLRVAHLVRPAFRAKLLVERLERCIFVETSSSIVANTVEKGQIMNVCIRDPQSGTLLPPFHTLHVVLHEMAHMLSCSVGHTSEFDDNFSELKEIAAETGLVPADLPSIPFCGSSHVP